MNKKACILAIGVALAFPTLTLAAEKTQIICQIEEGGMYPLQVGSGFEVPMEKLKESGTKYIVNGMDYQNDTLIIDRETGKFHYTSMTGSEARGSCKITKKKLVF